VPTALPFVDADALTGKDSAQSHFSRRQSFARITARADECCNFYRIFDERAVVNGLLSDYRGKV